MGREYFEQQQNQADDAETTATKDSNGTVLTTGDTVVAIKDLKVKGMAKTIKRGDKMKIKLTQDPAEVECRIGKSTLVLKTEYFKKI
jgi:protein PhnA